MGGGALAGSGNEASPPGSAVVDPQGPNAEQ